MFIYKDNLLVLKQGDFILPLEEICKKEKTAFYLYDIQGIREWYRFFISSTEKRLKVFFAMKSNFNPILLKTFQEEGAGVDVVSLGEARLAQNLDFSPQKIVFSGVGKSVEELEMVVEHNFFQINVESFEELKRLSLICEKKKKPAQIGLRINPNVDFESHPYIKTGLSGHKFGLEEEELDPLLNFIKQNQWIQLQGLSMHLGSQICDIEPLLKAIRSLRTLYEKIKQQNFPLKVLDIGGGLGINYEVFHLEEDKQRLKDFNKGLSSVLKSFEDLVITEPGRFLVARFGILCAKVEYIKKSPKKQFIILNSGMNHFLRPALYKSKHLILPFKKAPVEEIYDVVGPICETGDTFYEACPLPKMKEGDFLAIADTGAYGSVMSNSYNLQTPVRELAFDRGREISL